VPLKQAAWDKRPQLARGPAVGEKLRLMVFFFLANEGKRLLGLFRSMVPDSLC